MKLSFMTFVCPEWDLEKIVEFAGESEFDAVEFRVDKDHKHNISFKSSSESRRRARKIFENAGVGIACVATPEQFAFPDPEEHRKNIEAAKANLDLAADLGAPIARIFAGWAIPELTDKVAEQVAAAFDEVGDYAKASGVSPMMECGHDIIVGVPEATEVMTRVKTENFGVLWNDSEMDDGAFDMLKDRIKHFHIHDEVLDPNNTNILGLAKRMKGIDFKGYVSLEIIKGENLPENLLKETASRLKGYIEEADS